MVCREIEDNDVAAKYFAGELGPEVQDEFETHLLECIHCQDSVESLQLASEDLALRAHEIRNHSREPRFGVRWSWVVIAASMVLAATLLMLPLHHRSAVLKFEVARASPTVPGTANKSNHDLDMTGQRARMQTVQIRAGQGPKVDGSSAHISTEPTTQPLFEEEVHLNKAPDVDSDATLSANERMARLRLVKPPPYSFAATSRPGTGNREGTGFSSQAGRPSRFPSTPLAQSLFHEAMLAYVEKRYNDAGALLEDAVKQAPGSTEINFFLGVCRLINGPFAADAIEPLKLAAMDEKSPYSQSVHFYLAKAYAKAGDWTDASKEMRRASALPGPLVTESISQAADIEREISDQSEGASLGLVQPRQLSDEGEKELFRIATVDAPPFTTDEKHPELQSAVLAYKEANYDRAGQLLEQALRQRPAEPEALFYLGV
jgi:tetratricopeptide (TPR) repeat protein